MIDTHCHLTSTGLVERVGEVLEDAREMGVDTVISVATDWDDSRDTLDLARRYPGVYATAGVHPHRADRLTSLGMAQEMFEELAGQEHIVALGEIGLDYHYPTPPPEIQRRAFAWQLEAAVEMFSRHSPSQPIRPLSIILHCRQATADVLAMVKDSGIDGRRFVFHCFTGDAKELSAILDLGAMVGLTGIVTFKNAQALAEVARQIPLDRLLIETDAPYLTPEPHRKIHPNEPKYLTAIAAFLARQRNMSVEAFVAAVDANARRFFGLT